MNICARAYNTNSCIVFICCIINLECLHITSTNTRSVGLEICAKEIRLYELHPEHLVFTLFGIKIDAYRILVKNISSNGRFKDQVQLGRIILT
jgi:hypothetical protein